MIMMNAQDNNDGPTQISSLTDDDVEVSPPKIETDKSDPAIKEKEDEENDKESGVDDEESEDKSHRYLPKNKKPDAALTFPEKVRSLW